MGIIHGTIYSEDENVSGRPRRTGVARRCHVSATFEADIDARGHLRSLRTTGRCLGDDETAAIWASLRLRHKWKVLQKHNRWTLMIDSIVAAKLKALDGGEHT